MILASFVRGEVRMNIGASIVIKGELTAAEDVAIAGRVEGRIRLEAGVLTLAAGSQVVGDIAAATVFVDGHVHGNIAASERLDVRAAAVIQGDLTARALTVADGAQVTGRVEMPAQQRGAPLKLAVAV
jgi:cytoskeletal protein CcmA (bactofilin family)